MRINLYIDLKKQNEEIVSLPHSHKAVLMIVINIQIDC